VNERRTISFVPLLGKNPVTFSGFVNVECVAITTWPGWMDSTRVDFIMKKASILGKFGFVGT